MNLKKIYLKFISAILVFDLLTGCQSKNTELPVAPVENTGRTLDERIKQGENIDQKLKKISQIAQQISAIISRVQSFRDPSNTSQSYGLVNLLFDLNEALSGSIPSSHSKVTVFAGSFFMPGASAECAKYFSKLKLTEPKSGDVTDSTLYDYSIKGCGTDGAYLTVLSAVANDKTFQIRSNQENLRKVLGDSIKGMTKDTTCDVKNDAESIISSMTCRSLEVALTNTDMLLIDELNVNQNSALRLSLKGRIFANMIHKANWLLNVDAQGKVNSRLDPVNLSIGEISN